MSADSFSSIDLLPEGVLFAIFEHLNVQDLLSCEIVCHKWQTMIRSGIPWKSFFQKQMIECPVWEELNNNVEPESTSHYRDICRSALHYIQVVDRNWRIGNFTTEIQVMNNGAEWYSFAMSQDYFAFLGRDGIRFFDRETKQVKQTIIPDDVISGKESVFIHNEILIFTGQEEIRIFETATGQKMKHIPAEEGWIFLESRYSSGFLAVVSYHQSEPKTFRFSAFAVKSPSDVTLMMSCTYGGDSGVIFMDENYAVFAEVIFLDPISMFEQEEHRCNEREVLKTIHFVSTKTFEIERSLCLSDQTICYRKGLLLTGSYNCIRIFDVASGTYLHDVPDIPWYPGFSELPVWNVTDFVAVNSKFFILAKKVPKMCRVRVFDLQALRNPEADRNKLLLTTFDVQFQPYKIWADECQLVFMGTGRGDGGDSGIRLMVLDFKSLNPVPPAAESESIDDSLHLYNSFEALMQSLADLNDDDV